MTVNKPNNFVKGTPAIADEVNADFDTLYTFLNTSIVQGKGNPEGSFVATIGTIYEDVDPMGKGCIYKKCTSSGNTGWVDLSFIGSKDLDETYMLDDYVLGYNSTTNKVEYMKRITPEELAAEVSRAQAAEQEITNAIGAETLRAQTAEQNIVIVQNQSSDTGVAVQLLTNRLNKITGFDELGNPNQDVILPNLVLEDSTLQSNIDSANTAINKEVTDRAAADVTLQNNIDTVNTAINKEVIDRIDSKSMLISSISNVTNLLNQEITNRTTADATLQGNTDTVTTMLSQEVTDRASAIKTVSDSVDSANTAINKEVTDRAAADVTLQNNIDTVNNALSQEVSSRTAADSTLQSNIDSANTAINKEVTDRAAADVTLQNNIDTVNTAINKEVTDRAAAIKTVSDIVDSIKAYSTQKISSDYTESIIMGTKIILCDASANIINITLPKAINNTSMIKIKKIDASSNELKIFSSNSETIDGQLSYIFNTQNQFVTLISDNINWWII